MTCDRGVSIRFLPYGFVIGEDTTLLQAVTVSL